jgi:hypothetical protein
MGGREARDYWEEWGLVLLMTSLLSGPLAFGLNLQLGYAVVKWACASDQRFVPTLIAAVMFGVTLWAAWLAWSCLRQLRDGAHEHGGTMMDRSYFLSLLALGLNGILALLIAVTAVSHFVLSPCE